MMNEEPVFTESDWKLFRQKLPDWQEAYMEKLVKKYLSILSDESAFPSKRFWKIEELINRDKRKTGVMAQDIRRSNLIFLMEQLLREKAISKPDLEGFSENFRDFLIMITER